MKAFDFTVEGSAAGGQTWKSEGSVVVENSSDVFDAVMVMSFDQLTLGKAVYGVPGVGCKGPYELLKIMIERKKQ